MPIAEAVLSFRAASIYFKRQCRPAVSLKKIENRTSHRIGIILQIRRVRFEERLCRKGLRFRIAKYFPQSERA